MSSLDYALPRGCGPIGSAAATFAARARAVLQAMRKVREARTAARQLYAMSDAELRDIGIRRDDIAFLVRGHAEH
jgi:uncharacterized protein YjiS (DUF1127 family)